MPDPNVASLPQGTPSDTLSPASAPPVVSLEKDTGIDTVLHGAFMLGWKIVELKCRIQIALIELDDSGLHLASVWRACFNRIAGLQNKAFPRGATAQTLYEPPSKENLPYLYPPEPDYASVGISGTDTSGATLLDNFQLYEVTRRAINCLTLLFVKEDESLIPDVVKRNQNHLVAEILKAMQNPGGGGGVVQSIGDTS